MKESLKPTPKINAIFEEIQANDAFAELALDCNNTLFVDIEVLKEDDVIMDVLSFALENPGLVAKRDNLALFLIAEEQTFIDHAMKVAPKVMNRVELIMFRKKMEVK